MLLMFGIGLHFSLRELLSVRKIALPGAIVQIVIATTLGAGVPTWWGWPLAGAIVFGFALSVASTVVLLRAAESKGMLESVNGRIAVGWLVVEDLATVAVLVLLPPVASVLASRGALSAGELAITLGRTLLGVAAFVALMLVVGRRVFPWALSQITRTGSRELFTLCVVAAAVTIAYLSALLFGVSFALGAFIAGMVLRESQFSHRATQETLPLRDAFAVLFFCIGRHAVRPGCRARRAAEGARGLRDHRRGQVACRRYARAAPVLSAQHCAIPSSCHAWRGWCPTRRR